MLSKSGRALWKEEEIISFFRIPELAQLGKASGEQRANREEERHLAKSPGHEDRLGNFLRGAWRLASGREQSHNEASEVTEKRTFFLIQWGWSSCRKRQEVVGKQDRGKKTSHKSLKGTVGKTRLQILSFNVSRRTEFHCLMSYIDDMY